MRESCCGILERHCTRQAHAFFHADVRRHADTTDRWSAGNIVDHHDGLEPDMRQMDMDDLCRTKRIREAEHVLHDAIPFGL